MLIVLSPVDLLSTEEGTISMSPISGHKKRSTREATISVNPELDQKKKSTVESTISVNPNKQQIERVATIIETPDNTSRTNSNYKDETTSTSLNSNESNESQ